MAPKYFILALTIALSSAPLLQAASGVNLDQEYQQMRKVALRDPKVRAAYEEADRKLQAKIVQMDPALAHYQPRVSGEGDAAANASRPAAHTKPAGAATGGFHTTHTVAQGETLGAIASRYGVSVTALKNANHISDEKKLAIGQVLTIPPKTAKKVE